MQFIDLKAQQKRIRDQLEKRIINVLDHGKYIMGPEINELEEKLAEYVGVNYAISCSSGTDALLLTLLAYDIGPGDAIITTPFTFIATAEVIRLLGATPVFVDIATDTFNLDPCQLEQCIHALRECDRNLHRLPQVKSLSNLTPKGIIAVDLFGLPADYDKINKVAKKHGLFVIEDAAQSFGAEYNGKKACVLSDVGCTSFFPAKPLGCYGDGGMCFTQSKKISEVLRSLRVHGKGIHKYDNARIGLNGRLDSLQAAILLAKFEIFPEEIKHRQSVARRYEDLISQLKSGQNAGKEKSILTPQIPLGLVSAWAQYSILAHDEHHRSELQNRLKRAGIPTAIYYPKPLHLQPALADLAYCKGDFPICEDYANRIFSIPMHPYLKPEEQEKIAAILMSEDRVVRS